MSAAWTVTNITMKVGTVQVFGTVDLTSVPDPGEDVEASDIEQSMRTLELLDVAGDGTHIFEYQRMRLSGGFLVPLKTTGELITHVTGISPTGLRFKAVGRTVFRAAAAAEDRLVQSGEGRQTEDGDVRVVEEGT
jgi:hypothetical protein